MTTAQRPWWPQTPTIPQWVALIQQEPRELFYGGSVGSLKSSYLLMAASYYADQPGWHALLCRRTYSDLALPGSLLSRAREWWAGEDSPVHYSAQEKRFRWPSGASLTFGYLDAPDDHLRYRGAEFSFIGYDEAQDLRPEQMTFLLSRLRRSRANAGLPLQMRYAGTPGGIAGDWLRDRFISPPAPDPDRAYVPARMDTQHLDAEAYHRMLAEMPPIQRAQALGDWDIQADGGIFDLAHLQITPTPPPVAEAVRFWDLAATAPKRGRAPDYTAGALIGRTNDDDYVILDVQRLQAGPAQVEARIAQTAAADQAYPGLRIRMEQEPGSAGKIVVHNYARRTLAGRDFRGVPSTGSKAGRAGPLASAILNGLVTLQSGPWNLELLSEMRAFPTGPHDDQVDALAGAYNELAGRPRARAFTAHGEIPAVI